MSCFLILICFKYFVKIKFHLFIKFWNKKKNTEQQKTTRCQKGTLLVNGEFWTKNEEVAASCGGLGLTAPNPNVLSPIGLGHVSLVLLEERGPCDHNSHGTTSSFTRLMHIWQNIWPQKDSKPNHGRGFSGKNKWINNEMKKKKKRSFFLRKIKFIESNV